jgi:hypothetical protein
MLNVPSAFKLKLESATKVLLSNKVAEKILQKYVLGRFELETYSTNLVALQTRNRKLKKSLQKGFIALTLLCR